MSNAPDPALMRRAIELALEGVRTASGGPFGALVEREGRVIATGFNRVLVERDPTAHAEIVAIRGACAALQSFELDGCTLYTSCEPCPMCLGAIYWARLDRVVYGCGRNDAARAGFDDALLYEEFERAPSERKIRFESFLCDEALAAMQAWIAKPDRTPY